MAASLHDISVWFDEGVEKGATHMIVVCDKFDYEDYPCFVMPNEDVRAKEEYYNKASMQRVMEVYDLRASKCEQLYSNTRVFRY